MIKMFGALSVNEVARKGVMNKYSFSLTIEFFRMSISQNGLYIKTEKTGRPCHFGYHFLIPFSEKRNESGILLVIYSRKRYRHSEKQGNSSELIGLGSNLGRVPFRSIPIIRTSNHLFKRRHP